MNYICVLPNGYFGNSSRSWKSIDIDKVVHSIRQKGIAIKKIYIDEICQIDFQPTDILFYCSFDNKDVADYIKDLMYFVSKKVKIVPNLDMLVCFENKGAQELYKRENGIEDNIDGSYCFDIDNCSVEFPKIFKLNEGAASKGVFLIKNEKDLAYIRKKFFKNSLLRKLIQFQRKMKLTTAEYNIYKYRYKKFTPFVLQDYISDLDRDYKVLVYGDKIFVLTRFVRSGDFRASGSGKFLFESVDTSLLDYARNIFVSMKVPNISLDIAKKGGRYYLIEFQALNFGPYTAYASPWHYIYQNGAWLKNNGTVSLEECISHSYYWFLKNES